MYITEKNRVNWWLTDEVRRKIYNKYNHRCAYCGDLILYTKMVVDHIIPKNSISFTKDQLNMEVNLNPSCDECNTLKNDYDLETFRYKLFLGALRSGKYNGWYRTDWDMRFYFDTWVISIH